MASKDDRLTVAGDVDDAHGDVDARGAVSVDGSVRAGRSIRAGGDVEILGRVEAGAEILARGDVTVRGVVAGGRVRAGGRLLVGDDGTRSVDGGETLAVFGVELQGDAGPSRSAAALLALVPDPETSARLGKASEGLDFVENEIVRILRTLGLKTVDRRQIQSLFRATPSPKRKFLIEILKQLRQLVGLREQLAAKRTEQRARSAEHLQAVEIRVRGSAETGVVVRMGDAELSVADPLHAPVFYYADEAVHYRGGDAVEAAG